MYLNIFYVFSMINIGFIIDYFTKDTQLEFIKSLSTCVNINQFMLFNLFGIIGSSLTMYLN